MFGDPVFVLPRAGLGEAGGAGAGEPAPTWPGVRTGGGTTIPGCPPAVPMAVSSTALGAAGAAAALLLPALAEGGGAQGWGYVGRPARGTRGGGARSRAAPPTAIAGQCCGRSRQRCRPPLPRWVCLRLWCPPRKAAAGAIPTRASAPPAGRYTRGGDLPAALAGAFKDLLLASAAAVGPAVAGCGGGDNGADSGRAVTVAFAAAAAAAARAPGLAPDVALATVAVALVLEAALGICPLHSPVPAGGVSPRWVGCGAAGRDGPATGAR